MLCASGPKLLIAVEYANLALNRSFKRPLSFVRQSSSARLPLTPNVYSRRCLSNKQNIRIPESPSPKLQKPHEKRTINSVTSSKVTQDISETDDFDLDAFLEQRENQRRPNTGGSRLGGLSRASELSFKQPAEHIELPGIRKNFYEPSETTINRSEDEVREFRRIHKIRTSSDAPAPIFTLDEIPNIPANLIADLQESNITKCTPIQAQGIPIALCGRNVIGMAQTG